jgi:hypothetical protein
MLTWASTPICRHLDGSYLEGAVERHPLSACAVEGEAADAGKSAYDMKQQFCAIDGSCG